MALVDLTAGAVLILAATTAGAFGVLAIRHIGRTFYAILLSSAAGAMAFTSLEMLVQAHGSGGDMALVAGLLLGLGTIMLVERLLPHVHRHVRKKELADSKKKALLITGSIALHNIPEGFAVATAFASSTPVGWLIATSIALQDIPEGTLVSAPLAAYGIGERRSIFYGIFSGVVEATAAVLGYIFLSSFTALVPFALAFSAGAMIYVVFVEILPDAVEGGRERIAALSFIGGVLAAFVIANVFIF